MTNDTRSTPSVPVAAAPEATMLLEPLKILAACADPVRLGLLGELAKGDPLSVNDLAARLKRSPDVISKHLRVLHLARVLVTVASPDGDGRKQFQQIPAPLRIRDAASRNALDFGALVLRFD